MSNETVKIEYQFVGEDVGLTTKIEDIYKKLDKLGEGASVTIKKLDGLNSETITLTNTLNTATGKIEVFSSEMKELQAEADKATKEVNELIDALNKLNSNRNNNGGAITSQKQLNDITQAVLKNMEKINTVQQKLQTTKLDFSGTPKIKQIEKQLSSVVNQLEDANKLSNQLSNQSYRVNGNSISNIKNTKNNAKAIKAETKAIEANTQAQKINRKITNTTIRETPFNNNIGEYNKNNYNPFKISPVRTLKMLERASEIAKTDKEFNKVYQNYINTKQIANKKQEAIDALNAEKNSFNPHDVKKSQISPQRYEDLRKNIIPQAIEDAKPYKQAYTEAKTALYYRMKAIGADKEFFSIEQKRRVSQSNTIKQIQQETKAIQSNTRAKKENRKIANTNIKEAPFSESAKNTSLRNQITEGFNNGKKYNTASDFNRTNLEVSGKTIAGMYRATNSEVKKLVNTYKQEAEKRDILFNQIGKAEDNTLINKMNKLNDFKKEMAQLESTISKLEESNDKNRDEKIASATRKLEKTSSNFEKLNKEIIALKNSTDETFKSLTPEQRYIEQAIKAQRALKDVDNAMNNNVNKQKTYSLEGSRNYKKQIKQETQAIEENIQAQQKNYQVLGNLSRLKGITLKTPSTASKDNTITNINPNSISSQLNAKAKELEQAIVNNDINSVGRLQEEVKTLYSQQQALQKLQGVKLTNTSNTGYKTTDVVRLNAEQKAQQALNEAKTETLKLEEQIANKNAKTAERNTRNIQEQIKADENRHQLALANTRAYEESRQRQYEAGREYANQKRQDAYNFKQQQAYNKAVGQLPDEYKNLTGKYEVLTGKVKEETAKVQSVSNDLTRKSLKSYISSKDIEKAEKKLLNSQTKIKDYNAQIEKLGQRANRAISVAQNEALKVSGLNIAKQSKSYKTEEGTAKTYRVANGSSIKNTSSVLDNVKNYKQLGTEMGKAQEALSSEMLKLSTASIKLGNNLNGIQSGWGQFANSTKFVGEGITNLGNKISSLGRSMINTGQNVQMLANSLRTLSLLATSGFVYAGKEGIEFNRSLMGVASTLNRVQVQADGTITTMSDFEFDGIIENISKKAREQARTSIYDANQVMEAYRYTALAGWDADEMISSMDTFINLATVGRIEGDQFSKIVDLITDSLASLGMAYEGIDYDGDGVFDEKIRKDADGLAESVQKLSDVMVKAQSISNLSLDELSESYKKGASQLTLYGLELEEITALYSILANRGIKGSQAATGLSSIMANLTGKTGQAKKALDEITEKTGINVYAWDKNGKYIGIDKHLEKLSSAFKKLKEMYGTEYGMDNLQLTQMLGGKHHFKSLAKILEGYQTGEYHEILALLQNSEGSTEYMANIVNQSTWAQLKITLAEVKEAFLSLWEVIEPVFMDILQIIQQVARAFTELSDEQKMNIAKWMAIIIIGTTLASVFGSVLMVIGSLVSIFGTLIGGIGKIISFGGKLISIFTNWSGIAGLISTTFPSIASAGITTFGGLIKYIGLAVGKFSIFAGAIMISVNMLGKLGRAFSQAKKEGDGFLDTLGKTISNMTKEMEHSSLSFAEKITNLFNIDQDKLAKNLAKTFKNIINTVSSYINLMTFGLAEKVGKKIGEKTGLTGFKDWVIGRLDYRIENGMEGKNLFDSDLDRKAQAEGYENYEAKLKGDRNKAILNKITTIFDGEETGAFSNLIDKLENAEDTTITLETMKGDAGSYRVLEKSIEGSKDKIQELKDSVEESENKIKNYNKRIRELKEQIANTTNTNKKNKLQEELDKVKTDREAEIDLRISNKEELETEIEQLSQKEEKELVIKTTYEEAGLEEEFNYEKNKDDFEKLHGSKLSFVNADEDKSKAEELLGYIPEMKKQLEIKLDTASTTEEYNEMCNLLFKLEEMETIIPLYIELVNQQEIVSQTKDNMETQTKIIEEEKKKQENILKRTGLKPEELTGKNKTDYDNATAKIEKAQKDYDDFLSTHKEAEKAISELNSGDLDPIYEFWENMYANYNQPLIKLFDDNEIALIGKLYDFKGKDTKTAPKEKLDTNKKTTIPEKGIPEKPNAIKDYSSDTTNKNTTSTKENTEAVNENTQAVANNNKERENTPEVEIDSTPVEEFSSKVASTTEETNGNIDTIISKVQDMASAIGEMNLGGITEAFSLVYVAVEEARTQLSNIAGFAMNTGLASFTAMGDALKNAISEARTVLLGVCGIASNRGISSLTSMGNALTSSLEGARSKLLSICNVALNRGVNAMSSMGNALTSALSGASTTIAGLSKQINTIKNTANSIKVPSMNSSITPYMAPTSMANNISTMSALRSITNNSVNNSIANTSNFNINMSGIMSNNRKDIKTTARQLTTYCKRRGL